ncbi:hypothetical protein PGN35_000450 [Nodosilinea sp. PGN35]|uniref:hypothetical protein n=1 Tax=Nodosilinea sp. PGN35 TaxID=3020489 RepID=UPI0023B2BE67|nr:hypothetical protein [Nodosilinea sp. TSF1-S3]MDF0369116.1 hypothetical protein [Nodosilinea sp. TSF1-S3]MDF0369120.1 hypothetical protein [Nodosilinea sp. TSF1-S3]
MSDLALSIAAVALTLVLATVGLAAAGGSDGRSKFPKRMQGGGSQSNADIEQVEGDE